MASNANRQVERLLTFWFADHSQDDWFGGQQKFDVAVRIAFAKELRQAEKCELAHWRETPQGRLAEIIILDQFSRQLYRDSARAFANDALCLALAQELVTQGHLMDLTPTQCQFALLPFMHSESLVIHDAALPLFEAFTDDNTVKFEKAHRDVLERFGRYPKRNAALGRASTSEELAYMEERKGSMF